MAVGFGSTGQVILHFVLFISSSILLPEKIGTSYWILDD